MNTQKKKESVINPKLLRALIAVAAAVVLWFYVNGSTSNLIIRRINQIPVTIVGTEDLEKKGLYLSDSDVEYFINLTLQGTEQNMKNVDASLFSASVDVSGIETAGTYTGDILLNGLPHSIILEEMNPLSVTFSVEEIREKKMDVKVITVGSPAEGYKLRSASADTQVKLTGLSTALGGVDHVEAVIYLNGLNADSVQDVVPIPCDKDGKQVDEITIIPQSVRVNIKIEAVQNSKE